MKTKDFDKLLEFQNVGGGMTPVNDKSEEMLDQTKRGDILTFLEVTERDLKFHKAFFGLLDYIYDYLPPSFQRKVRKKDFYKYIQVLQGNFEIAFTLTKGSNKIMLVNYDSVAFGNMSQKRFESFVRGVLPFIYERILA